MSNNQLKELVDLMLKLALLAFAAVVGGIAWTVATAVGLNPFNDDPDESALNRILDYRDEVGDDLPGGGGV